MTQTPPAAPATPPPNPDAAQGDPFAQAQANAAQRIEEAFPTPPAPGDPAPPAAPPAEPDFWDESATPELDQLQYRDGKRLEAEIKRARETFRPFRDAFGTLDDDQRAALLEAAPDLGGDLAFLANAARTMHSDDRQWIAQVMGLMATDPEAAAAELTRAAGILRGDGQGNEPPPGEPFTPPGEPTGDEPMTQAAFERAMQERDAAAAEARRQEEFQSAFLSKARELGYDPDSRDEADVLRFNSLLDAASRTGGDIDKAHEAVSAWEQAAVDRFVQGKAADANRPGAPVDTGKPPVQAAPELPPMEEALARTNARLEGAFGPDPRRRGED